MEEDYGSTMGCHQFCSSFLWTEFCRRSHRPEAIWFGSRWISSLLFADDVVLLAPSSQDLQHVLGQFAVMCEAAGMKNITFTTMVVDCCNAVIVSVCHGEES